LGKKYRSFRSSLCICYHNYYLKISNSLWRKIECLWNLISLSCIL
jgi:hypothetical protein